MKLIKKLVIMTGKGYEKGTVNLEKNAVETSGRVNIHNLRDLSNEEYILFLVSETGCYFVEIGLMGTCSKQFTLPLDADISSLHCAVLVGEAVALYGTTESKRMWEGNIIDIARRAIFESKKNDNQEIKNKNQNTQEHSSERLANDKQEHPENQLANDKRDNQQKKDINDYFLDIIGDYNDDAVAEVNYFSVPLKKDTKNIHVENNIQTPVHESCADNNTLVSNQESSANNIANQEIRADIVENMPEKPITGDILNNSTPLYSQRQQEELITASASRPFLTEKYYTRWQNTVNDVSKKIDSQSTSSEQNTKNDTTINNNATMDDEPSYSEIYSNKKFKAYYDTLKEKYGYHKNVLSDYKQEKENGKPITKINNTETYVGTATKSSIKNTVKKNTEKPNSEKEYTIPILEKPTEMRQSTPFFEKPNSEKEHINPKTEISAINHEKEKLVPIIEAASTLAIEAPPLESPFERIRVGTFFEQIKDQIEEIFKKHPHNSELENLIPDSKWVRVDYNNDGKYYVVGLIGKPDYICYGVPAIYTPEPPAELDGYCQWLPLDLSNPTKQGYWLLFQDAVSGDSIKNEII